VVCVCVSTFTCRGVFLGSWGSSTNLAEAVTHQVVADRPSHKVETLRTFSSIIHFGIRNTPEQTRRTWKPQTDPNEPTPSTWGLSSHVTLMEM
jgi:hypothetical protein